MRKEDKTWGGKRKSVGRPRVTAKAYSFKADKDLINVLDAQENRNRFINNAVREKAVKESLL